MPKPPRLGLVPSVNYEPPGHSGVGPLGMWRKRAGRLIGQMNNAKAHAEMRPFLREAEDWLVAACTQLAAASGGQCGPIEANALATAAWQTAYARFWMHKAAENPADTKLFETASRVADAARANSLAAYDIAVRLHRHKPVNTDPLAFIEAQDRALPPSRGPAYVDPESILNEEPKRESVPAGVHSTPPTDPPPSLESTDLDELDAS